MDFIKKKKNRELVLTTLIDLLVQILFIFTIVLIIKVSTEAGKNGSFNDDLPEVWKTLVSEVLGVNSLNKSSKENAQAIKDKIKKLEEEIEKLKRKIQMLGGGAPGKPLCLDSDKKTIDFILEVAIIDNSTISIQPTATASDMMASDKLPRIDGFGNIFLQDFDKKFNSWFKHGDTQIGWGCRYRAIITYSDNISASVLHRTQKTVGKLFYSVTRGE